jgi:HPt (histidine-containing phosphotransfer) domain-containing protein
MTDTNPNPSADTNADATLEPNVKRTRRTIELAISLLPDADERLRGAVESGDAERVRAEAHRFKGSCLSIGATRLAQRCLALEHAPASSEVRSAFVADLASELEALRVKLQDEVRALPPGAK